MKLGSSEHAIRSLQYQIHCLAEEQTDALETATFIGLTEEETEQYADRRCRILELVQQLRQLDTAA
jgi:Asp-tRNA(Asn)/Glu-tRNA(Gln) amidotransferase C subunit